MLDGPQTAWSAFSGNYFFDAGFQDCCTRGRQGGAHPEQQQENSGRRIQAEHHEERDARAVLREWPLSGSVPRRTRRLRFSSRDRHSCRRCRKHSGLAASRAHAHHPLMTARFCRGRIDFGENAIQLATVRRGVERHPDPRRHRRRRRRGIPEPATRVRPASYRPTNGRHRRLRAGHTWPMCVRHVCLVLAQRAEGLIPPGSVLAPPGRSRAVPQTQSVGTAPAPPPDRAVVGEVDGVLYRRRLHRRWLPHL
jgi:hypothetical protein